MGQLAGGIPHHNDGSIADQNQLVLVVVVEVSDDGGSSIEANRAVHLRSIGSLQIPDRIPLSVIFFIENQDLG